MRHVHLGRTGLAVSRLCLGTMTFGLQCDEDTSRGSSTAPRRAVAAEICFVADAIESLAWFANLLDRLDVHDPPHPMFVDLALHGGIKPTPDWFLRALYKEVAMLAEETNDPYPADYELIASWIDTNPALPDPNQQQSWPWIVEQAWQHRALTDAAAREPWPVPSETLSIDGYEVVPLRCALDLRTEAEAMRNCLATYEKDCRAGKLAVYSIRKGARRFANLELERVKDGGGWELTQVAGKGNREVPEMAGVAMAVVRQLGGARP